MLVQITIEQLKKFDAHKIFSMIIIMSKQLIHFQ